MIHDIGEKCPIVAYQQDGLVSVVQVVFEPPGGFEIEVIRRLVEQKDVGRAHQLSCQAESSAFATAQLLQRLCARFLRIEPKTLKHCVYPWGKRVASLAIESFEIAVVPRQHLRGSGLPDLRELPALLRQRVFEREKIREFSRSRFPDSLRPTEIAMLLEECHSQSGLLRHGAFGWFLHSGDHPEKRRLPTSIPAQGLPNGRPCRP